MDHTLQYTIFIILAPLAALFLLSLLAYARAAFPSPQINALNWLLVTIAGWLIFNTLELINPTEAGSVFWAKISYPFITFTPVAWLGFALQFAGNQKWLTIKRFVFFCILPCITSIIVWTNEWHLFHWQTYHFEPIGNMLAFRVDFGPWFWVHIGYSYILVFLGAFLILRQYLRSFRLYRQQSIWVAIGASIPIVVNYIYVRQLIPGWQKDYTSVSFALASLAFVVGIFRYRLFDLKPVVRDALVDSMSDAMIALDDRERIVDINPATLALVNLPSDQLIGQSVREIFPSWYDQIESDWDQNEIHTEIETKVDGKNRYYDLRITPLTDRRGRSAGRLALLHDITALKETQAALLQSNIELESSNKELDAFAQTVAHDLKSPLTSLNMALFLLQSSFETDADPNDIEEALTTIENTTQKIVNIVDALLLLSSVRKLEEITLRPFDSGEIIAEVLKRLRVLIEKNQAEFILPERWPLALGYGPWIEEVWVNYISNAMKYGQKPMRIELGADILSKKKGIPMVRFWVRDNGPGIPLDRQKNIFMPFTRLGDLRIEGQGLGLSIVLRIVTKLRGEVGVESQQGVGSLFWFTLPAYLPDDE